MPAANHALAPRVLRAYGDNAIIQPADDAYDFKSYADAFANIINDKQTFTPLTVAISGPWGSGKTSLAKLLENRLTTVEAFWRLSWDRPPITCWFNAWTHTDAPNLGAALAASVTRDVGRHRPLPWKLIRPLPAAMVSPRWVTLRRTGIGVVAAGVALLGILAVLALFPALRPETGSLGHLFGHWDVATIAAAVPATIALVRVMFKVSDPVSAFIDAPRSAVAAGNLEEVRRDVGSVIRQAQHGYDIAPRRRVVIFIDDLERCPAQQALDMCEVVSQILNHQNVVTVLIADLDLLEAAARDRYQSAAAGRSPGQPDVGVEYLQKLIQLRFNLPPLDANEVRTALGFPPLAGAEGNAP